MKDKIIVLSFLSFFFLSIFSCGPKLTFIPHSSDLFLLDFSKYSEKGFLITPHKYLGDYKSLGLITVISYPEAELKTFQYEKSYASYQVWEFNSVKTEKLIDAMFDEALTLGADAIIDFNSKNVKKIEPVIDPLTKEFLVIEGIELTGFAIKRLGAIK